MYTGWHADSIRFDFPELNEDTTDLEVSAPVWTHRLDGPKTGLDEIGHQWRCEHLQLSRSEQTERRPTSPT